MVKYGSFQQESSSRSIAALKSSLVIALCALLLIQPAVGAAQEPAATSPQSDGSPTLEVSSVQPPDELPSAPVPQTPSQPQQQAQPGQQPSAPQQPVGTAAAPYEKPTGVSGSRPAGAAIAPAKQRRVRAIVISFALVLAGAGAIGAVAGMSKASHSQP